MPAPTKTVTASFLLLAVLSLSGCVSPAAKLGVEQSRSSQPAPVTTVDYNDLGRSVVVTGPLGKPLGEVISISGRWVRADEKTDYWSAKLETTNQRFERIGTVDVSTLVMNN